MRMFRIALTKFCDVSGEGARLYGGRWNLPGYAALYAANSIAAALLERLTIDPELFSSERYRMYSIMEIQCEDALIYQPPITKLPKGWDAIPFSKQTQEYGTNLIQSGILCFMVPSVVDKSSLNFIIDPNATDFKKLEWKIYPLSLDGRIIR